MIALPLQAAFSQVLLGVIVLLIAAGVGGGVVMYGTVQRIDERTKALPDLTRDVGTLREDMASVKTQLDIDSREGGADEGEPAPATDGGEERE
jgi:hypothetical protein